MAAWNVSMKAGVRTVMSAGLRFAVLLLAGFLVAVAVVMYDANASWLPSGRWLALAVWTLTMFSFVIRDFRRSWSSLTLWASLLGLLAIHVAAYVVVLRAIEEWRAIWFFPASVVEYAAITFILQLLGYNDRRVLPPCRRDLF